MILTRPQAMRGAAAGCLLALTAGASLYKIVQRCIQRKRSGKASDEAHTHCQQGAASGKVSTTSTAAPKHGAVHSTGQPQSDELQTKAQHDAARLQSQYARMAAEFSSQGLDLQAIAEAAAWFETGPTAPWPRRYSSFIPKPLAPSSVRLLVIPISTCCPQLANLAARLSGEILACLPPGYKVFSNARQNLHITVFHFSHPADPRPDALDPHSGLGHVVAPQQSSTVSETASSQVVSQSVGNNRNHQLGAASTVVGGTTADVVTLLPAPGDRLGPTQQQLAREQSAASTVLSSISPFELQVERVLLARSGVLLLTWVDRSGALGQLRKSLKQTFPGACSRQSSIIHTSLFRIVETAPPAAAGEGGGGSGAGQLSPAVIADIQAACDRWTNKVAGMQMCVDHLWWVEEHEFSSIEGYRVPMGLRGVV